VASPDQVIEQVRFGLNQLARKNGHHTFEELCRHLVRARICSNVIPATGPVSARGDQGRDFETYRTYLVERGPYVQAFVARASSDDLVFVCTLQQGDLASKVRSDVATVMGGGRRPSAIYALCEANVPVAVRHRMQDECKEKYGVRLELLDGNAIANMLSDRDTFWIASTYLSVPAEIYPRSPVDEDAKWYENALARWKLTDTDALTAGDFVEISELARHATFASEEHRHDVPFWLNLLRACLQSPWAVLFRRKALYDIAVVSLRGLGTLIGREDDIRAYFDGLHALTDPAELKDAQVLLMYLATAEDMGLVHLGASLPQWVHVLRDRLQFLVERTTGNARFAHYESLGFTLINPMLGGLANADAAIDCWLRVLEEIDSAPLLPIQSMADAIGIIAVPLSEIPRYEELMARLDAVVGERVGRSAAASRRRDRAMAFYKAERFLPALREFHRAKEDWFSGDTVRGSLLAMALIARCYEELQLYAAAKYYYLAMAFVADRTGDASDRDLLVAGILGAASADYSIGAWAQFLHLSSFGTRAHQALTANPGDLAEDGQIASTLFQQSVALAIADRVASSLVPAIRDLLTEGASIGFVDELRSGRDPWAEGGVADALGRAASQLGALPFSDLGPVRTLSWRALGIHWTLRFSTDRVTTFAAERLAEVAQVVSADLAQEDLCLLASVVDVTVSVGPSFRHSDVTVTDDNVRCWDVTLRSPLLSPGCDRDAAVSDGLGIVAAVLSEVSLLGDDQFGELLERRFREGLSAKVMVGNLYDTVAAAIVPAPDATEDARRALAPPQLPRPVVAPEHDELARRTGIGPTYSDEKAQTFLRRRYEGFLAGIQLTLPRLRERSGFDDVITSLRKDGWLDWQILGALCSIAWSYRADQLARRLHLPSPDAAAKPYAGRPETPDMPIVPLSEFAEARIREVGPVGMVASLKAWDLQLRQYQPDIAAIEQFLSGRYRHWTDDIPHDDPFQRSAPVAPRTS